MDGILYSERNSIFFSKGYSVAGSVNKVTLIGNLGKDPEVRFAADGARIVSMTVATNESWRDKQTGERKDKTEWHRVVVFNDKIGEVAEKYLKKGSKVYLEGQLQTRKWTDNAGVEKYSTEVVIPRFRGEMTLLDSRSGGAGDFDGAYDSAPRMSSGNDVSLGSGGGALDFDDEIPF